MRFQSNEGDEISFQSNEGDEIPIQQRWRDADPTAPTAVHSKPWRRMTVQFGMKRVVSNGQTDDSRQAGLDRGRHPVTACSSTPLVHEAISLNPYQWTGVPEYINVAVNL